MKMRFRICSVLAICVGVTGPGSQDTLALANSETKTIRVYTARHYPADLEIYESFKAQHGIEIESVLIKNSAQLVERVLAETSAPQADMVITTDIGQVMHLASKGALIPIDSPLIHRVVPADLRDNISDFWTAFAIRARVIAYRKSAVRLDEISSIESLSEPKWKGRLLVRQSSHVYNQSLGATLLAAHGADGFRKWAQGITKNLARKPQGGDTEQIKAIANGEGDLAIVNSYYAARLSASSDSRDKNIMSEVGLTYPNQDGRGAHVNGSGIGLLRGAKNSAHAKKFAEFLLDRQSQETITLVSKEFPVRTDVKADSALGDAARIKFDFKSLKSIYANTPQAIAILDEVGWR